MVAAKLGLLWGIGHSVTIMAVGAAIISFKLAIPPMMAAGLEILVGVMIALLGALNILGVRGASLEVAPHSHIPPLPLSGGGGYPSALAFGAGLVHGLAGSAALSLLVLAAIPSPGGAIVYLAVYSVGTMAGMAVLSAAMGWTLKGVGARFSPHLQVGTGIASLAFGLYLIYHIGGRAIGS